MGPVRTDPVLNNKRMVLETGVASEDGETLELKALYYPTSEHGDVVADAVVFGAGSFRVVCGADKVPYMAVEATLINTITSPADSAVIKPDSPITHMFNLIAVVAGEAIGRMFKASSGCWSSEVRVFLQLTNFFTHLTNASTH